MDKDKPLHTKQADRTTELFQQYIKTCELEIEKLKQRISTYRTAIDVVELVHKEFEKR